MACFPYLKLPLELQTLVLESMDLSTLATTCRLSKDVSATAIPLLWRHVDLNRISRRGRTVWRGGKWPPRRAEYEPLRSFFLTCYFMRKRNPERWRVLMSHVEVLRLGKIPGITMPITEEVNAHNNWHALTIMDAETHIDDEDMHAVVYDVISGFSNLKELDFFLSENYWDYEDEADRTAKEMHGALPHLKKLNVGGDITQQMMLAFLNSTSQHLEQLSCIAVSDGSVGQDYHSRNLVYLSSVREPFPKLRSLHLCKLAELSDPDHGSHPGVRWPWDPDDDYNALSDWAAFIKHTSQTLEHLTLEDRYLVAGGSVIPRDREKRRIDPGGRFLRIKRMTDGVVCKDADKDEEDGEPEDGDPLDWGQASRNRFRERLVPVLLSDQLSWPKLKKLTLIGLALPSLPPTAGTAAVALDDNPDAELLDDLKRCLQQHRPEEQQQVENEVEIEVRRAGVMPCHDTSTPISLSPVSIRSE